MIQAHIPEAVDPHEPGAKLDFGKVRVGLMVQDFPRALVAVSEVCTYGANKYSDSGWLHVRLGHSRYNDALFRHLLSAAAGEENDQESGMAHLAHAAWNALALLELKLRG